MTNTCKHCGKTDFDLSAGCLSPIIYSAAVGDWLCNKKDAVLKGPAKTNIIKLRRDIQRKLDLKITTAQAHCAELLHVDRRSWQKWENGDRKMHPAFWELINLKT